MLVETMLRKILNFQIGRYKNYGKTKTLFYLIYIYLIFYNKLIPKKSETYALSFEKSRFDDDIEAIKKYSSVNIIKIPLKVSVTLASYFLPKHLHSQKNYHMTTNENDYSFKEQYKEFLLLIVSLLMEKIQVDALIVGNFDYWEHQEWTNAFNEFQISTFCIYRESYSWKSKITWRKKLYSDFNNLIPKMEICVFGNQSKEWLENLPCLVNANFHIIGAPRTDFHFYNIKNSNIKKENKNKVVLFDYFGQNYGDDVSICSHHNFKFVDLNTKFCISCEETFFDISAEVIKKFIVLSSLSTLENFDFVIKTKEKFYSDFIMKQFNKELSQNKNITISDNIDFKEILLESKVIIGSFRSTAIIEAMLSEATIILPNWDKQIDPMLDTYSKLETLNVFKIKQKNDFENIIIDILENYRKTDNNKVSKRLQLIEEGLYKLDGKSSKRFEELYKNL